MGTLLGRAGVRLTFALATAVIALGLFSAARATRAQAPSAVFSYAVYPAGWNLVSFGDLPGLQVSGGASSPVTGPLFTFQPGDTSYEQTTLQRLKPGAGYWADFAVTFSVLIDQSALTSWQTVLPAGQCAMVGNPSTLGSARVTGADRVYTFSAVLNNYVAETLVGIGRGAWACNDSTGTESVNVSYVPNPVAVSWPDCCQPQPVGGGGLGVVTFENDSPAPLIVGARQIDATGQAASLTDNNFVRGSLQGCGSCPEYTNHGACNPASTTSTSSLLPGTYTLHLHSDASNVDDFQLNITIQPDTSYVLCFFVSANR